MSGSSVSGGLSGTALSSLPLYVEPPEPTDQIFGIFNGVAQFVSQSQVWAGALPTVGGSIGGAVCWTGTPSSASHLTNKLYVDQQVASVSGAVASSATQAAGYASSAQLYMQGAGNAASTSIAAQKGTANGIAPLSAKGNLMLGGIEFMGVASGLPIMIVDLPTSDPSVAGAMFNNGGYVMVSAG